MSFLSYLKDGISLGSIYAIIALGYTMVYGIAKMLNFAHGDVIMVGAFVILTAVTKGGMSPVLAIVLSVIFCTVLGMVIEKVAYSPLRKASSNLAVLITAIGVSYLLQNLALLIFGADAKSFVTVIDVPSVSLFDGQLVIKGITIVTILTCIVIMVGLMLFVQKTKPGRAMQAVSEDRDAAQLMGVNVNATISMTFAIGSGLAAIAGLLLCQTYPTLTPYTGAMPGIKAFVAAVFGGIGSIPGAMVGGILLGVIEIFGKAYISSQVADAICFGVLIVVLLVKPTGLFGKKMGLPVKRFIAANNKNDIFYQYLQTGQYNPRPSVATIANAMDVGDPSNFARVLDLYGASHAAISAGITGAAYTDEQIRETVKKTYEDMHYLLDPHGACGYRALEEGLQPGETGVFLETAHPAKFLDTVEGIIGDKVEIPAKLQAFMKGEKKSLPMTKEFADFKKYLLSL
jgi:branched-chain amino acid transport system permease protein